MCGVFGQVKLTFTASDSKLNRFKRMVSQFTTDLQSCFVPNSNIWVGMYAYIIHQKNPDAVSKAVFGLTPRWSKKRMYLFNARSEGRFNEENSPNYSGTFGIFEMPSFKEAIKNNRCLIPMDYFIEGPEKEGLDKPHYIFRTDREPFFVGGISTDWVDRKTGEIFTTFSIVTTPAAPLLGGLPHHRSPLVFTTDSSLELWMDKLANQRAISGLFRPFDSTEFSLKKLNQNIKTRTNNIALP